MPQPQQSCLSLQVHPGAGQSPQPSPPRAELSWCWGLSCWFWGLSCRFGAWLTLRVASSTRRARRWFWGRRQPGQSQRRAGGSSLARDAPCSAPSCGTGAHLALACSSLHPTLHADAHRLHPSMAQRWVFGERGRFSPWGGAGYQGCCGILHPTARRAPAHPSPLCPRTANGPFISRGGTNGAVRCHQPCDMTGCGSRGPSNRAALSVRAA